MMRVMVREDYSRMERYDKTLFAKSEAATRTVAEMLKNDIKGSWSPSSPSPVGSPPAVVTGELQDSIQLEKAGRDDLGRFASAKDATGWLVTIRAEYAAVLENPTYNPPYGYNRPYLAPAIDRASQQFPMIFRRTL